MDLLNKIRDQIREQLAARSTAQTDLDALISTVSTEGRSDLNDDETSKLAEFRTALEASDTALAALQAREAELVDIEARKTAADALAASLPETPAKPAVRVGSEPLTYREGGEASFLSDAFNSRYTGDPDAAQRLHRHAAEMRVEFAGKEVRDIGTSAFAGLVVPQYLVDLYAPLARAGRPFANRVRNLPLPAKGMTVNISRITTGSAVTSQASENTGATETNMDDTLLTVPVNTLSGMQDVSRQAVERGEMIDAIVVADLVEAYHTELDRQVINGSGAAGEHTGLLSQAGINAVTYTDASPTVPEAYPKFADALQQINAARFLPADLIALAPRRWGWITAALDSSNRPLVLPSGSAKFNTAANGEQGYDAVGDLQGVDVITDGNIPVNLGGGTNEDRAIVCRASDLILWEEPSQPLRLRFEEVLGHQLTIRFVVYGYSAWTAGRYPASTSVISGTGLITPSF